jgi:hypothetical protein
MKRFAKEAEVCYLLMLAEYDPAEADAPLDGLLKRLALASHSICLLHYVELLRELPKAARLEKVIELSIALCGILGWEEPDLSISMVLASHIVCDKDSGRSLITTLVNSRYACAHTLEVDPERFKVRSIFFDADNVPESFAEVMDKLRTTEAEALIASMGEANGAS